MSHCSSGLRECECCFCPLNTRDLLTNDCRMIVIAVYSLIVAHPGPIFGRSDANVYESDVTATSDGFTAKAEPGVSAAESSV